MTRKQKMHILLEKEILVRLIPIAAQEFNGNLSQYIRVTIFNDLVRRGKLLDSEKRLLVDDKSN